MVHTYHQHLFPFEPAFGSTSPPPPLSLALTVCLFVKAAKRAKTGAKMPTAAARKSDKRVERDMQVLSLLMETVPSYQLPLAVTETIHDLLVSRDRTLNVVYGLFAGKWLA